MQKYWFYIVLAIAQLHLLSSCSNSQSFDEYITDSEELYKAIISTEGLYTEAEKSLYPDETATRTEGLYTEVEKDLIVSSELKIDAKKYIPAARFSASFVLKAALPKLNGIVRCTFDGSEPNQDTEPFLTDKTIDKTTVVRCTEFVQNEPRQKQTETYFIDESIKMPIVSISVDPVYVNEYLDAPPCEPAPCRSAKFWEDVEYPVHVEYFAEGSNAKTKSFEIDAGISVMGQWSRNQQKKSVSIVIRKQYQKEKLHYSLFDTRPNNNVFKAFNLRNNGQRFISDYIEDAMATSLLEGTNVDYQRSKQVIVFYNGVFYGIYDMREKLNEHFVETNYGISDDNVDMVKHYYTDITIENGTDKDYRGLLQYVNDNDFSVNADAYDSVSKLIDMGNFMEYMAAEIYYHNNDWPQNNVRAWKSPNTPFKFIVFDTDFSFDWTRNNGSNFQEQNMIDWIIQGGRLNGTCAQTQNKYCFHNIFKKLIQNDSFRQSFINRVSYLYSTYINKNKIAQQIDKINESIDKEQIQRDLDLYKRPSYKNYCGGGFDTKGDCLKKWSNERDKTVRDEFRSKFDVGNDVTISIKINGNGKLKLDDIYVTQSDVYNWTVFEKNPISLSVVCDNSAESVTWEDGSQGSLRTISPINNKTYTATCK